MTKIGYVYILANKRNGTTYIGVTSDLTRRIVQHKEKHVTGFSYDYNTINLVYIEKHDDIRNALIRERQLKKWNREWKLKLIEENNPQWKDHSLDF